MCGFFSAGLQCLGEPIDKYEQSQPHDVNKVPIPSHCLESKVVLGGEMSLDAADQNHRQHNGTERHMETMKTSEHEES